MERVSYEPAHHLGLSSRLTLLGMLLATGCHQTPTEPGATAQARVTASANATAEIFSSLSTELSILDLSFFLPPGWSAMSLDGNLSAQQGLAVSPVGIKFQVDGKASAEDATGRLLRGGELSDIEVLESESVAREDLNIWTLRGRAKNQGRPVYWIALLVPRKDSTAVLKAFTPDSSVIDANLADFVAIGDSLAVKSATKASPTPFDTAGQQKNLVATVTPKADMEQAQINFNQNLQWSTPANWKDIDGKWMTPDQVLVKCWQISEKGELSADIVTALLHRSEFTAVELDQPPTSVTQGDFRLWTVSGKGNKRNEKRVIEAVDWAACVVEPLKPVQRSGHMVFVAIGLRGEGVKCRRALLTLTQTIQQTSSGGTPPTVKISIEPR